jgi:signal transduction histidine kinase/CheY-like chemotaxis protein
MKECSGAKYGVLFSCEHGDIGQFVLDDRPDAVSGVSELWHDEVFAELSRAGGPALLKELPRGDELYPAVRRTPNAVTVPLTVGNDLSWIVYLDGFVDSIDSKVKACLSNMAEIGSLLISFGRRQAVAFTPETTQGHHHEEWHRLGIVAGTAIHDINNLLAGILLHAATGQESIDVGDDTIDHFSKIETAARRMTELCRKVLNDASGRATEHEAMDLNELVEETADLFTYSLSKRIKVTFDRAKQETRIAGSAVQIQRALINLLKNSAEAIANNPGEIRVKIDSTSCDAAAISNVFWRGGAAPGNYAVLSVSDTGPGILESDKQLVFAAFHSTKTNGYGLGLTGVKSILEEHGGMLDVRTCPGQGSTFDVYLPVQQEFLEKPKGEIKTGIRDKTVLVIEDEMDIQRITAKTLQAQGVHVLCASDGATGLSLLHEDASAVDAVLLDMNTPGMDCQSVFQAILLAAPNCGIVLSSGYYDAHKVAQIDSKKKAVFLQKPYLKDDLMSALSKSVGLENHDQKG